MTVAQQIEDLVIAQRKLLWPLSPAERSSRLTEIRADYEYENQLSLVADAMSEEEEAEAEAQDARGGMIAVMVVEAAVLLAFVAAAAFWSGIGSGAI